MGFYHLTLVEDTNISRNGSYHPYAMYPGITESVVLQQSARLTVRLLFSVASSVLRQILLSRLVLFYILTHDLVEMVFMKTSLRRQVSLLVLRVQQQLSSSTVFPNDEAVRPSMEDVYSW